MESARDRDRPPLRHQHSANFEHRHSLVPMWDSSDPERAPPPLPLNPQSPGVHHVSRAGTSSAIQSAHAALAEKARESAALVPHIPRRNDISPDRPLPNIPRGGPGPGPHASNTSHRRMQSLGPPSVKDISLMLEAGSHAPLQPPASSPEKNGRPKTPSAVRRNSWINMDSQNDRDDKLSGVSPQPGPSLTPILRPTARRVQQSILGENTPPQSATMLALQNMSAQNTSAYTTNHHFTSSPISTAPLQPTLQSSSMPLPKEPDPPTPLANITNNSKPTPSAPPPITTQPSFSQSMFSQSSFPHVSHHSLDILSNQILTLTDIATTLQKEMSLLSRRSRDNATDLLSLKEATNARDEDIRKSLRDLLSVERKRDSVAAAAGTTASRGDPFLDVNKSHPATGGGRPFSLPRIPSPNSFAASLDRESILSTPSLLSAMSGQGEQTVTMLEKIIKDMGTKDGQELLLSRLTHLAENLSGMATGEKIEELARFIRESQEEIRLGQEELRLGQEELKAASASPKKDDEERSNAEMSLVKVGGEPDPAVNEEILAAIRVIKDSIAHSGGLTAEVKALTGKLRGEVLHMGRELGQKFDELLSDPARAAAAAGTSTSDASADAHPPSLTKEEMAKVVEQGIQELSEQMNRTLNEYRREVLAANSNVVTNALAVTTTGAPAVPREAAGISSSVSEGGGYGPGHGTGHGGGQFDAQELYNAMRAALKDTQAQKPKGQELRREDVMAAVKEAWEKYKPEIEIQQIGLEKDEVLEVLQEGLRTYHTPAAPQVTKDEVFEAVAEGMKTYVPPKVEFPPQLSKEQVLEAVRECLDEFEFPIAPAADEGAKLGKEDVLDAVRAGITELPKPEKGISTDDVMDAVLAALQGFDFSASYSSALVQQPITKGDVSEAIKSGLKGLDLSDELIDAVREGIERGDLEAKMVQAVKTGLQNFDIAALAAMIPRPDLSRVDVADAVKEGLEFLDLSRDDVADAVKEGLNALDLTKSLTTSVVAAVKEALKDVDFSSASSAGPAGESSRALVPHTGRSVSAGDFPSSSSFTASSGSASLSRQDIIEAVKDGLDNLDVSRDVEEAVKKALATVAPAVGLTKSDVIDAVKEGIPVTDLSTEIAADLIDAVKKELQTADGKNNNEEILNKLLEIKNLMAAEFKAASESAKQNAANEELLGATKEGFDKLRTDIESYVDKASGNSEQKQFMGDLLRKLDDFRDEVGVLVMQSTDKSKAMLEEEISSLRDAVNSSIIPAVPQANLHGQKEVLEALHEGVSSLRSEISNRTTTSLTEILDAVQEGLTDIRTSINNLRDKPADLTANDEILEALKTGLDTVRADIDEIRKSGNDRALATIPKDDERERTFAALQNIAKNDDIKNLEVLLTQLATKVEAMQSTPAPAVETLSKDDVAGLQATLKQVSEKVAAMPSQAPLSAMEDALKKIQETVAGLEARSREPPVVAAAAIPRAPIDPATLADAASREDVIAIETILRNTKARMDDMIDGEQAVRKDHIDALEALILETRESLAGVVGHMETMAKKENLDSIETIVLESRENAAGLSGQVESLSRKEDIAKVESLVNQVIASFDDMKERHEKALEDPEKVTKTDVDALEAVCIDTKHLIEQIIHAEDFDKLDVTLRELKECMDFHAEAEAHALDDRQAEIMGVSNRVEEVKGILEEFHGILRNKLEEGAHGVDSIHKLLVGFSGTLSNAIQKNESIGDDLKEVLDTMKTEFEDSKTIASGAKLEIDEKIQSTTDLVISKLDERMGELLLKYDDFQLAQEERAAKGEERDTNMEAAVVGNKAIAEELKSLVDTLGSAVTDSLEKMEEASKTVFERVTELCVKYDENNADAKAEHQLTRENVKDAIGKVDGLQDQVAEFQPKILATLEDFVMSVTQHYEELSAKTQKIHERVEDPIFPEIPKYDDALVQEKLDALVDHAETTGKNLEKLDTLEQVHTQVKATAAELAVYIAAQTQRIADEHEDREKSLQETVVALERRLEEKEQVETQIADLRTEQERLKQYITVDVPAEQAKISEAFLANLHAEEARLREAIDALKVEQDSLKEHFLSGLKEEQGRLMEANLALKDEQETLKAMFIANLEEEKARMIESNVAVKEEQEKMRETFLASLKEDEARLKEMNEALREEGQNIRDTYMANLREEESLLKEVNAGLRAEQQALRDAFVTSFKEEELRLRETNNAIREEGEKTKATLKEEHETLKAKLKEEYESAKAALIAEQETLKATLKAEQEALRAQLKAEQEALHASMKEDNEKLKIQLLSNLLEEEGRIKEHNTVMRAEQDEIRKTFVAQLKEDDQRIRDSLTLLRAEQEELDSRKNNLRGDLSTLEAACRFRREQIEDLTNKADSFDRKILESVIDMSKVMLMKKAVSGNSGSSAAPASGMIFKEDEVEAAAEDLAERAGRDRSVSGFPLSRKRVPSANFAAKVEDAPSEKTANTSKPRSAPTAAAPVVTLTPGATPKKVRTGSNVSGISSTSEARRILSLSQISGNAGTPAGGMKRSQSVRNQTSSGNLRKPSWTPANPGSVPGSAPGSRAASKSYGDLGGGNARSFSFATVADADAQEDRENAQAAEDSDAEDSTPTPAQPASRSVSASVPRSRVVSKAGSVVVEDVEDMEEEIKRLERELAGENKASTPEEVKEEEEPERRASPIPEAEEPESPTKSEVKVEDEDEEDDEDDKAEESESNDDSFEDLGEAETTPPATAETKAAAETKSADTKKDDVVDSDADSESDSASEYDDEEEDDEDDEEDQEKTTSNLDANANTNTDTNPDAEATESNMAGGGERRVSTGTTVITPLPEDSETYSDPSDDEVYGGGGNNPGEDDEEDDEDDDVASVWTDGPGAMPKAMGTETEFTIPDRSELGVK
ncbi:putative ATPase [Cladorrhinum sp. PSN259]|nr:putative ATPase [Cladorrhinum sp. PSN259]